MDFYRAEYDDYWSRQDRWGTNSFVNVEQILVPLLTCCGPGRTLDVGCGMGRLVKALLRRGLDAHGMDVAERVIAAHREVWPDRFHLGSATRLPFDDGAFDTISSSDCLEHISPADLAHVAAEFGRVSRRNVYLTVSTALDRDRRWHLTVRPRPWWETLFFGAGFRRHPRMSAAVPFVGLEDEPWQIPLVFERDPAGSAADPADWGTRCDREADAYLAFYDLASRFVRPGHRVVDLASETGFGSAVLAAWNPDAMVSGETTAENLAYAAAHYGAAYRNLAFSEAGRPGDRADVVVLRMGAEWLESGSPWNALALAADRAASGGALIVSIPCGPGSVTGISTARTAWSLAVEEAVCPPVSGLSVRHLFGLSWHERRDLREVKLPARGISPEADAWVLVFQKEAARVSVPVVGPRRDKVVVLAHHGSGDHYGELLKHCPFPVEFVHRYGVDWEPPIDAGLVMSLETYDEPGVSALRSAVEHGVPTLILADGITEYRNTWQHPQNLPGAMMQPVLGHKVACIGPGQARILESWGNYGKCEIVGAPRFDRYLGRGRARTGDGPSVVLVATAKTPYFTPSQRTAVLQGLRDLRVFFARDAAGSAPQFSAAWRVAPDLESDLGLGDGDRRFAHDDVAEALDAADALVTTPSTLMVEGMLAGLPVAVLDYGNAPAYYSAAWRISAPTHVETVLRGLRAPTAPERLFQDYALHDLCACTTPAAPRMRMLITAMMDRGRESWESGAPLAFPPRLLPADPTSVLPENTFDMAALYPGHALHRRNSIGALHYEVDSLRRLIGGRESDLNRFDRALRAFDADVTARHQGVSAFERDLLAFKDELARRSAEVARREAQSSTWWTSGDSGQASVGCLLGRVLSTIADDRKVYCWGAGAMGGQLISLLGEASGTITAFVDSDPCRVGEAWGKPVVLAREFLAEATSARPFVLVASCYAPDIARTLDAHGFEPGRDYLTLPPLQP